MDKWFVCDIEEEVFCWKIDIYFLSDGLKLKNWSVLLINFYEIELNVFLKLIINSNLGMLLFLVYCIKL